MAERDRRLLLDHAAIGRAMILTAAASGVGDWVILPNFILIDLDKTI